MLKILSKKTTLAILILFVASRIINLLKLPIFNDEATYINWSWKMIYERQLFYSLLHAKPPLTMWLIGISRYVMNNPLLAGRTVSIIASLFTFLGIYKIGIEYFDKKFTSISLLIYSLIPIFTFFDRQALMEAMLTTIGVWTLYYSLGIIYKNLQIDYLKLGFLSGIGYLIKTNAMVYSIEAFIGILIVNYINNDLKKLKSINFILSLLISLIIMSPILLNKYFWLTLGQNEKYVFSLKELLSLPFQSWGTNILNYLSILLLYFGPLLIIISVAGIYLLYKKERSVFILITVFITFGLFFTVFMDRLTITRHSSPYLLVLIFPISFYLKEVKNAKLGALLFVSLLQPAVLTLLLIFRPLLYFDLLDKYSKVSQKHDYVTNWSSGYGVNETVSYLKNISQGKPTILAVRVDAGIPEDAVFTYFQDSKNYLPVYFDTTIYPDLENYDCIHSAIPFYFVSRDLNFNGMDRFLIEEKRFYKPEDKHFIGIFKLKDNCEGKTLEIK